MDVNHNYLQNISVEQFVSEIMQQYVKKLDVAVQEQKKSAEEDFILYGYHTGWLEDLDVPGRNSWIDRMTAARIVHQFLRMELKEKDENHTSDASRLQDLYDCRRCAGHVMQVYTKGIMNGHVDKAGRYIFGMGEKISVKEAQEIVERVLYEEQRETPMQVQAQENEADQKTKQITREEAFHYLQSDKYALLIDVRTAREFQENHLEGAKNIPLSAIIKNPYMVSDRRDNLILLYCEEGYQSEIAANCLLDAGYEKVLCFGRYKNK